MKKSGYDLTDGDQFNYGGKHYRAVGTPTGEFNAYVKVFDFDRSEYSEIIVRHGDTVEVVE
jgi:hypothetical protein